MPTARGPLAPFGIPTSTDAWYGVIVYLFVRVKDQSEGVVGRHRPRPYPCDLGTLALMPHLFSRGG